MKRIAMVLLVLFTAASLFAGGKECKKADAKHVELTGTLSRTGSGEEAKTVFRAADGGKSYTVCDKSKAAVLTSSDAAGTYRVKGKLVSCGDGEELVIDSAKKI